ncbi:uncharacterized protein LOC129720536 [Wyeomyia smithii]|uniref:uncharacterized protein LOC129720536 n=1 Tax=Wyeomyia smithii TaxID=174621 RepID=UPI0024680586|nr:uncharacterized protein LOC129720536 [Wyeomyia smithii]
MPASVQQSSRSCVWSGRGGSPKCKPRPPRLQQPSLFSSCLTPGHDFAASTVEAVAVPNATEELQPATRSCSCPTVTLTADASSELKIYYQNTNGLRTKIDQLFLSSTELDYDVYVFTETNLDDRIQSCQLFNNDFCVYRVDRCASNSQRQSGGGVLIAVKRLYASSVVQLTAADNIEHLWVKIAIEPLPLFIGVLYLPPDKSRDINLVMLHIDAVSEISRKFSDIGKLVLLGDFNQPRLAWKSSGSGYAFVDPVQSQLSLASQSLLDNMAFLRLRQHNLIRNNLDRVLDLVFSRDSVIKDGAVSLAVEEVVPIDPYHPPICFTVLCEPTVSFHQDIDLTERDFRRGDYDTLNELLSEVDWSEVIQNSDVDCAVSCFNRTIQNCIVQAVPLKRPPKTPVWSNKHLRILRRRRSNLLKQYCQHKSLYAKRQFDEASRTYRGYNRFLYKRYVRRREEDLRRNPKRFWSFVNSKRKENGLPILMHLGNVNAASTETKCALFSQQFASLFENRVPTAVSLVPRDVIDFDVFNINATMVGAALQKLKQSYKPGPDGIPSCIFKKCSASLTAPLLAIFNRSLQHQVFPSEWKISHMLPVHKKGEKSDIANYRGMTSLSAGSKCFEIIMKDMLFSSCRSYISIAQHGFYLKRSVDTNLCEFTSFCIGAMDGGAQVDAVYTDIKAAFDTLASLIPEQQTALRKNWINSI